MINSKSSPVSWVLLIDELDEAKEHLESLITDMAGAGEMDEDEFAIYLGHVYAHLNRAWNGRYSSLDLVLSDEQRDSFSQFPIDIKPMG